jgi:hypothetical protein
MKGWLLVDPPALNTDARLQKWIDVAVAYASALPPK